MGKSLIYNQLNLPTAKRTMIGLGGLILVGWAAITVILFVEYRKSKALLAEYTPVVNRYNYYKNLGEKHRMLETMTIPEASLKVLARDSAQVSISAEKKDYTVVILFTKNDCFACLETELDLWQSSTTTMLKTSTWSP